MPRAHRYYLPQQLWHLTHRCHERGFLLRLASDRSRYLHWLSEATKRFGLRVLDYAVTSNHVHLLVQDTGDQVVSRSMQLIAGCTAQEFNRRNARNGAFWEDRYHATAIEADEHLHRCLVYIDLNMVRAGVARHPVDWRHCGYVEIQQQRQQPNRIIDLPALSELCGFSCVERFQAAHRLWVQDALSQSELGREPMWSEAVAIGSKGFVNTVQVGLGLKARYRRVDRPLVDTYTLREAIAESIESPSTSACSS